MKGKEVQNFVSKAEVGGDLIAGENAVKQTYYTTLVNYHIPADRAYHRFRLILDKFMILYKDLVSSAQRISAASVFLGVSVIVFAPLLKSLPIPIAVFVTMFWVGICIMTFLIIISEGVENFRTRRKIFREFDAFEEYVTNESPEMGKLIILITKLRKEVYPIPIFRTQKHFKRKKKFINRLKKEARAYWRQVREQLKNDVVLKVHQEGAG